MIRFLSLSFFFFSFLNFPLTGFALDLGNAIGVGLKDSPTSLKADSAYEEASWKRVESYSGFLPTLTAGANYLTNKRYMLTDINFGGNPTSVPAIVPTTNYTLTAQWSLFDGFASTHRYQASRANEEAALAEKEWTRFKLTRQIELAFFKALAANTLKDVAEQNVKTLQDHLKDSRLFKKSGMGTNYDILRVEVQVSEAESEVLNAQDNIELSKMSLAETLGMEKDIDEIQGKLPEISPDVITNIQKKLKAEDVDGRKDLSAAQNRVEGLSYIESAQANHWLPRVSAFGQYQYYNNINDKMNDRDAFREAYQVGFNLTWTLFEGMSSFAKSKEAVQTRFQAEQNLRSSQLKAHQDFEFWKRKLNYFSTVYRARYNDVQKSKESVRLAKEGRRVGARTNTDLLDAETELYRAQASSVNAQMGTIEALLQLELATGKNLYNFVQ